LANNVLVLSEQKEGELDNVTYELLTKGREVANLWGTKLAVLVLGSNTDSLTKVLTDTSAADIILVADNPILQGYNAEVYCKVISDAVRDFKPSLFLMGYTYLGMEVGPAVAARLGATLFSNCVDLEASDGKVTVTRPMYNGTVHTKMEIQGEPPYIISFQKGSLPRQVPPSKSTSVSSVPVEIDESSIRSRIIGLLQAVAGEIDITKAEIIVSVGRGVGTKANIQILKDLADALGGVIACSRPVADMGWLPPECQVGISGKTVTPKIYIACGISGACHHIAAMRDSNMIIAINKDPNAAIFSAAHYGVVGDLLEVVPALTEEARKSI